MSICENKLFEKVFDEQSEALRNFLYYKCCDIDKAEDLLQDAFLKLWNNCRKVVYEKARSFLFTVANNLFLNDYAHQKIVLEHQSQPNNLSNNESPQFLMEEEEFMTRLKKAIAQLTPAQREVFLMNRIDKKTFKEIAELLSISDKTVEKRMQKALISLKNSLKVAL
jgi:RNA polymerase sigma-70 factor (ECF subfamily)